MFFWKRNNLVFIELGNFNIRSSLIVKKFTKTVVSQQVSCVNQAYKNGIVRNKELFVSHIEQIISQYDQRFDSVVIGLNSSYINYDFFKTGEKATFEEVSQTIPERKIIHFKSQKNKTATLSVDNNFINKIYSALEPFEFSSIRFVATDYLKAVSIDKQKTTMVINIGYKCTNLSIFRDDFLEFYKTTLIGAESLVLAVAKRFEISIIESIELLKSCNIEKQDSRSWVEFGGKSFNSEHVSNVVGFYVEVLANKILQNNLEKYDKIDHCVVTGWGSIINGIDSVLSKYIKDVIPKVESDQLASHIRIKDLLLA